jgi:hypothetical protein
MKFNPATAAIPGQSLTGELGSKPWEKPAQFNDLDSAMDAVLPRLLDPDTGTKLMDLLEKDVSITSLVDTLLTSGFMEGKWTPDLAVLMAAPIYETLKEMAEIAGIKYRTGLKKDQKNQFEGDKTMIGLAMSKANEELDADPEPAVKEVPPEAPAADPPARASIMAPKKKEVM